MKLDNQELLEFTAAVERAYDEASFTMLLRLPPVGKRLENVAREGIWKARVFEALDAANRENWIDDVIEALAGNPENQNTELMAVIERLKSQAAPGGGEPHRSLVLGSRVFVDRDDLRAEIALTGRGDTFAPRVYVIRGAPASGKSYCYWLAQFVGREYAGAEIAFFDVDTGGEPADAHAVVTSLAAQMGMPEPPQLADDPQPATRARRYRDWFVGQARQLPGTWWLVIDSLDLETASASVMDFIAGLAETVERGLLENMRLFLLGYSARLPPEVEMQVARVDLQPIAEPDVRLYLQSLKEGFGLPPDVDDVDSGIRLCFEDLPDPPRAHEHLMQMVARLSAIARAAIRARGNAGG